MSCSETCDPLEAEGAHRLDQDHHAGDDRRRPVGVQAGDLDPLGERGRGELREHPLDRAAGSSDVAVDPRRGRRARAPSRSRPARSGCRRRRSRPARPRRRRRPPPRSARARRRRALRARPRSAGRRRCGARCGGRRRPAARCGRRSRRRVPTISSVEPPPMSIDQRRLRRRLLGGGAQVGEPRLLLAVEDPRREREALAQLGDEGAAVARRRGRRWSRSRRPARRPSSCRSLDVLADRRAGVLDRLRREPPGEVDAAAQPGHRAAPLDRRAPAPPRRRRPAAAPSWCRRRSPRPAFAATLHHWPANSRAEPNRWSAQGERAS